MSSTGAVSQPSSSAGSRPYLLLVKDGKQQTLSLESLPLSIGRRATNTVVLKNPHVSREHAIIIQEVNEYVLVDKGSKHGTYVNGERIQRKRLEPNDRLEFGVPAAGVLIFSPDKPTSTTREFLNQVTALPGQAPKSDLEMLTFFLEAARKLNTAGVLKDVLLTLIDTTIKLTHAERGFVFLLGADGELRLAAGQDAQGVALTDDSTISRSLLEEAAHSTSEFLVQDALRSSQFTQRSSIIANELRTIICIPLRKSRLREKKAGPANAAEECAGVLYLDSRVASTAVSTTNNDVLRAIATEAASLLENAKLVQAEEESRKVQQELNIASSIQQRLMAVTIPEPGFATVRARSIPCKEIGGDFFDVVMTGEGLAVIVADVCGKGISAAILASILQGMIYSQLSNSVPLSEIMKATNIYLCQKNLDGKFATVVMARLNREGALEYVNCGHVSPILVRSTGIDRMEDANVPVGLMADASYSSTQVKLQPGDRVVLFSDGITEAQNAKGEFYGDDRLHTSARSHSPVETILQSVIQFCAEAAFEDDCTVVDLVYKG
jgi:serine phosphatase RsbU (regulator of sigma subunit)